MHFGRAIGTAFAGLFFMAFLSLDLVLFGVIALDSAVVTVLMAIGLLGGGVLGWIAGARRERRAAAPPPASPAAGAPLPPPAPSA